MEKAKDVLEYEQKSMAGRGISNIKEKPKYLTKEFYVEEFIKKFIGYIIAGLIILGGFLWKCTYEKWHTKPPQRTTKKEIESPNKKTPKDTALLLKNNKFFLT